MRAIGIYTDDFLKNSIGDIIAADLLQIKHTSIPVALVRLPDPQFDPAKFKQEVLVRKEAFSCNYRDMGLMLSFKAQLDKYPDRGFIPIGSEFSGTVVAVGKQVENLCVGDRVIPNADYPGSPYSLAPAGLPTNHSSLEYEIIHQEKLAPIPDNMPYEVGAGFTIGAQTAYAMIERLQIEASKKLLVTAANSNTSQFVLRALRHRTDIQIYATVRREETRSRLSLPQPGRIFVIPDEVDDLMRLDPVYDDIAYTGKFDYVIDPFADKNLFRLLDILAVGAKYITCGASNQFFSERSDVDLSHEFAKLVMNNITIMGNCLGSSAMLERALADFGADRFDVAIDEVIAGDMVRFMKATFDKNNRIGKVIYKY